MVERQPRAVVVLDEGDSRGVRPCHQLATALGPDGEAGGVVSVRHQVKRLDVRPDQPLQRRQIGTLSVVGHRDQPCPRQREEVDRARVGGGVDQDGVAGIDERTGDQIDRLLATRCPEDVVNRCPDAARARSDAICSPGAAVPRVGLVIARAPCRRHVFDAAAHHRVAGDPSRVSAAGLRRRALQRRARSVRRHQGRRPARPATAARSRTCAGPRAAAGARGCACGDPGPTPPPQPLLVLDEGAAPTYDDTSLGLEIGVTRARWLFRCVESAWARDGGGSLYPAGIRAP